MDLPQITWINLGVIVVPQSGIELLSSNSHSWIFICSSASAKPDWKQAGWIQPIYEVESFFTLGKTQELKLGRNLIYIPFCPFTMKLIARSWVRDLNIEILQGSA